ncbi:MAG: hypothetical protein GEV11_10970 [Streptosporangiales bacterium]|nr:hypothetical protein [Streptosporangiales bacterium]
MADRGDFELYLLAAMRCDAALIDAALRTAGADRQEMSAAARRIREATSGNAGTARVAEILGEHVWSGTATVQGRGWPARRYPLRLWPGFDFEVVTGPRGLWLDGGFRRAAGAARPDVREPATLPPWGVTAGEVADLFGPLMDGDYLPPYTEYFITGAHGAYLATFGWDLLQRIEPAGYVHR